jgi:hypothetical protein
MMPLPQKRLTFILGVLILIGGVFIILAWKQSENRKPNITTPTQSEPVFPTPSSDEPGATTSSTSRATILMPNRDKTLPPTSIVNVIITPSSSASEPGYQTIRNTFCGVTFVIPSKWSVDGFLGESKIRSPEDQRKNAEWERTHQDLVQNEEGDAPLTDVRSLVIFCQENIRSYLRDFSGSAYFKDFENALTLADAFASDAFHANDSNVALLKTMKINGRDAYEIADAGKMWDGTPVTNYSIVLGQGEIIVIALDLTEYDNLSDAAKQIIQSISFEG